MRDLEHAETLLTVLIEQLRLAMFGIGAVSVADLRDTKRLVRVAQSTDADNQ